MYTGKHLNEDILAQFQGISDDEIASPVIMTAKLIHKHRECCEGDDLFTFCTFRHVRDVIGKRLVKLVKRQQDGQVEMYPLLQQRYIIIREEVEQAVPRHKMTVIERRQKANELRSEGMKKIDHGNQFDRETDALIAAGYLEAA